MLGTCLAASGAWACTTEPLRGQATVFSQLDSTPDRLPQEVQFKVGDLLSMLTPRDAKILVVDANGKKTEAVVPLNAERYQTLSSQGRGTVPADVRANAYPPHMEWRYFGAAASGLAYLKLSASKKHDLVRIHVMERPVMPRGTDVIWNEARQYEAIGLTQFDTLTLDLPGAPGDGWQLGMRSGKAALTSALQVAQGAGAQSARVLLRVEVIPGAPEDELTIQRAGGEVYRFTVHALPMPAC